MGWKKKKECDDNELGLSTLRCKKGHCGSFCQIQSWISAQLGDGEFPKGAQESHRERQQQLLGSWTHSLQNVDVRDYTEIGCQCLVAKVRRNISHSSRPLQVSHSFPSLEMIL